MTEYESRLKIPIVRVEPLEFYTKGVHKLLATDYTRIVIGGRGPYIEFTVHMVNWNHAVMSIDTRWRTEHQNAYYLEFRSNDTAFVKIYAQKRTVDYADYKVGMVYISPFELELSDKTTIIDKLR